MLHMIFDVIDIAQYLFQNGCLVFCTLLKCKSLSSYFPFEIVGNRTTTAVGDTNSVKYKEVE